MLPTAHRGHRFWRSLRTGLCFYSWASLVAQTVKNLLTKQETWIDSWSGRFPGEGNVNPLQYSCLENPRHRGIGWATVHGVANSQTRLSD